MYSSISIAPLTTKSAAPEAEWSDTDVDMVGTVLDTIVGMDVEFEAQTIH